MATIRPKDLPVVTEPVAGDRIIIDGATTRVIDVADFAVYYASAGQVLISGTPTINQFVNWTNATTIKGTSITGLVKGNGASAPAAAVAGTDYLDKGTTSLLTVGYTQTSYSAGTFTTGTYTPSAANGGFQHATNNGAHTLAPPAAASSVVIEYTNGASAGAITTSGFTKVYGAFDTTNTNKFLCNIIKTNSYSLLQITPLQ